jgi:hypothetical protein
VGKGASISKEWPGAESFLVDDKVPMCQRLLVKQLNVSILSEK